MVFGTEIPCLCQREAQPCKRLARECHQVSFDYTHAYRRVLRARKTTTQAGAGNQRWATGPTALKSRLEQLLLQEGASLDAAASDNSIESSPSAVTRVEARTDRVTHACHQPEPNSTQIHTHPYPSPNLRVPGALLACLLACLLAGWLARSLAHTHKRTHARTHTCLRRVIGWCQQTTIGGMRKRLRRI